MDVSEHPLQYFLDWNEPWNRVFLEQYERIITLIEEERGSKLDAISQVAVGFHGNVHCFRCVVGVRSLPGKSWYSRCKSFFSAREYEFVRLFPLGTSDEVLAAGIIGNDPGLEKAIRFHFDDYARNRGMRVNWGYML